MEQSIVGSGTGERLSHLWHFLAVFNSGICRTDLFLGNERDVWTRVKITEGAAVECNFIRRVLRICSRYYCQGNQCKPGSSRLRGTLANQHASVIFQSPDSEFCIFGPRLEACRYTGCKDQPVV